MRIFFLFLFFISLIKIDGQSLVIKDVKMSSGDASIEIAVLGNTSFYEIACISTKGTIYTFDGRQLKKWSSKSLKNFEFYDNIFIQDSLLYVEIENKYYQFDKDSNFPVKVSKTHVEENTPFPWHQAFNNTNNHFSLSENKLLWSNIKLNINTSIYINKASFLVTSAWGKPYFIIDKSLHSASTTPLSYEKDFLTRKNLAPTKSFRRHNFIAFVYKDYIYLPQFDQSISLPQDQGFPKKIINIVGSDSENFTNNHSFILLTEERAYMHFNNKWTAFQHKLNPTEVTSYTTFNNELFITTKNQGIHTSSLLNTSDNIRQLVPHKLNQKLIEYDFISANLINKTLYFFTKKNGVLSTEEKLLKIIKSSADISQVILHENNAIIISPNGELLIFDEPKKKVSKLKNHIPSFNPLALVSNNNEIFYTHSDSLFTYSIKDNKTIHRLPFKLSLEKAFPKNERLFCFMQNDRYSTFPKFINHSEAPKLQKAFLSTATDKTFQIYPRNSSLSLTTEDYPLNFWAEASYLENPSSIEYKYSWNDSKVKQRPFRFNEDYQLKTKLIGTAQASVTLKSGASMQKFKLAPISTKRVQEKADYTFILYLAAGIILFLLGTIILSLFRNRRQKAKIEKLENQQLMMEMEQKALQMQMNPHFIFNSLNGVKGMIALGKTKNAKEYLTKISGWIRNMLNDARKSNVSLSDEIKNLSLYLDIERELRGENFNFEVEDKVGDRSINIPSMMIQPFIENALIHAFDGSQNEALIKLEFHQKGRKVQVIIEDNGKGLSESKSSHKSVAMELIRERLAIWNKKGNLYGVNVINKNEINSNSTGVRIELDLPIMDKT